MNAWSDKPCNIYETIKVGAIYIKTDDISTYYVGKMRKLLMRQKLPFLYCVYGAVRYFKRQFCQTL